MRRLMVLLCCGAVAAAFTSLTANAGFPGFTPEDCGHVSAAASGRATEVPSVRAMRLDGGCVVLDGRLDESFWAEAEPAGGFRIWDPTRGDPASEETIFRVVYDDEAVYFGIACLESGASRPAGQLCRRDHISNSDMISLYLDTHGDNTTAYNFRLNVNGVQGDRYVSDDGNNMDSNWDAVWESETWTDEDGWYAEVRIPFSCVSYRPADEMTWGCQLYRFMFAIGEDTSWANWEKERTGFVSRFGRLTGLSGVRAPRQLELLPYVVTRTTDPSAPEPEDELDQYQNFGLDLKYGLTADLTLNAAFQPDFGQVEADPALLNLSPFETYYEEKRPFFIEGSSFFSQPNFNMFYSRRIGTGDENSRIRAAGKMTGKTAGGYSIAALYALTDVTGRGRAHQFWNGGEQSTSYLVGRVGKESSGGDHRVGLMQTAVLRSADRDEFGDYLSRNAYTSGADFELNWRDRTLNVQGSVVGSAVDHAASESDPALSDGITYGTGGSLNLRKRGGTFQAGLWGNWETDKLDLNDVGFLSAPDEIGAGGWVRYQHNPRSGCGPFSEGNLELSVSRGWLYAAAAGYDRNTGDRVWSYGRGRPASLDLELSSYWGLRSFWAFWFGAGGDFDGVSKYETRTFEGVLGPLMEDPNSVWAWWGVGSDWRKPVHVELEGNLSSNVRGGRAYETNLSVDWMATNAVILSAGVHYDRYHADAQHIDNFADPGGGIGGVSYVFASMDRQTLDSTLRADILFTRHLSLQLYAQPYLTTAKFSHPRQLARQASYDFEPADGIDGFDPDRVSDYDFKYGEVNVNAVLRWEYAPGSAFFLVWKQGRDIWEERSGAGHFDSELHALDLFDNEPENVILAKLTYWFSI